MIYIGWGAEEPGLVGSYHWIRHHQDLIREGRAERQPRGDRDRDVRRTASPRSCRARLLLGSTSPAMQTLASRPCRDEHRRAARRRAADGVPRAERRHHPDRPRGLLRAGRAGVHHGLDLAVLPHDRGHPGQGQPRRPRARDRVHHEVVRNVQAVPPGASRAEVPTVKVTAPPRPAPAPPSLSRSRSPASTASRQDDRVRSSRSRTTTGPSPRASPRTSAAAATAGRCPPGSTDAGRTRHPRDTVDAAYFANGFAASTSARRRARRRGLLSRPAAAGGSSPCTSTGG